MQGNLRVMCLEASGLPYKDDDVFRSWAKWINNINKEFDNGFTFEGKLILNKTCEFFPFDFPRLILCCVAHGTAEKTIFREFQVVAMNTEGKLSPVKGLYASDNKDKGWALQIRDAVAYMMDQIMADYIQHLSPNMKTDPLPNIKTETLIAALEKRGYEIRKITKPRRRT